MSKLIQKPIAEKQKNIPFVISKWNGAKRSGMRNPLNVENGTDCRILILKGFFAYGSE